MSTRFVLGGGEQRFSVWSWMRRLLCSPGFWVGGCVAVLSFFVFRGLTEYGIQSDIRKHCELMQLMLGERLLPGHFLYHLTVLVCSLFSSDLTVLLYGSYGVLSLCVFAKFWICKRLVFVELAPGARLLRRGGLFRTRFWISLLLLGLLFCHSLPAHLPLMKKLYRGQFPPNLWHNPTLIFLMPLAMALFYCSYRFLKSGRWHDLWLILFFSVLNIIAKPSFFLVFCLVFPLFSWFRFRWTKPFFLSLLVLFVAGCAMLLQYFYIFNFAAEAFQLELKPSRGGVQIQFFGMWRFLSSHPLRSLLVSLVLPLFFLLFYPRRAFRSLLFRYTCMLVAVSLVIFCTLRETGIRRNHANFLWQVIVCNYMLFFVVLLEFLKIICSQFKIRWREVLFLLLYLLHVATGVFYLIKTFVTSDYY